MSSGKLWDENLKLTKRKKNRKIFDIETLPYHVQKQRFSRLY